MANPYGAVGSVATVASSISGGAGGASGGPDAERPGRFAQEHAHYRPGARPAHRAFAHTWSSFLLSFAASAAISVVLQLYVPILVGRGIDCIIAAGRVDFSAHASSCSSSWSSCAAALQWVRRVL